MYLPLVGRESLLSAVSRGLILSLRAGHIVGNFIGNGIGVVKDGLEGLGVTLPAAWMNNQLGTVQYVVLKSGALTINVLWVLLTDQNAPGLPYNTFDGPGFAACHEVANIYQPTTVDEIVELVKTASNDGIPVRASGKGHMWYDTMCSDDPKTIIIRTDAVNGISSLVLENGAGSVIVEAGVTFMELADWLHERGASIGYTLVNWNITIAGAIATGSHRSSLREDSQVSSAALAMDIINGKGELVHLEKDTSDTWLAATASLGLLGIIARVKFAVIADFKVHSNQTILDEDEVLNGDIYTQISPYVTANYWWWPGLKKFHLRTYDVVPIETEGNAFQSTFSVTLLEGKSALRLLNAGQDFSTPNFVAERIFYNLWSKPNFHDKITDRQLNSWPVYGWAYDVLIGGLYPNQRPEWEYDLHGKTLELAVPVTQANALLKRVRELFDEAKAAGKAVTSTYRSGINIKFDAYLAQVIIDEFPARPHWTKNTREVFTRAVKNLDQDSLKRFAKVREQFDPQKTFKSIVGEIIGVV